VHTKVDDAISAVKRRLPPVINIIFRKLQHKSHIHFYLVASSQLNLRKIKCLTPQC